MTEMTKTVMLNKECNSNEEELNIVDCYCIILQARPNFTIICKVWSFFSQTSF